MRSVLAILLVGLFASGAHGQLAEDLVTGQVKVRNAAIYLSLADAHGPATVVRVADVYRDFATKGFFRIGVLPVGVLQGVTFEIGQSSQLTNALARIHKWLGKNNARRIELRHVRFVIGSGSPGRLEAGRGRVAADGVWELFDGVKYASETSHFETSRAVLHLTGENEERHAPSRR